MARGLNTKIYDYYLKPLPGQNSKTEDLELATTHVELAQNCRFEDEPGAVVKRPPIAKFNGTSTGSGAVQSLYRYYTTGGVKKWIKIWTTGAYVGADATGTFAAIRTGLTTGKKTSFVTYKDLLIASNGFDNPWVYDGASDNVTWELGSCKALLGSGAGNLDQDTYYYAVVFNTAADGSGTSTGITGAVSNTITCDGSNQKIELSNIPLGPAGTLSRIVYRTEGGGSALKQLTVIGDNTTTTYSDNVADGSLTTAYPAVADDMPVGNMLKLHRERLFMSGDPSNPNKIYYSEAYLPHYIRQTTNLDYMQVDENDGDEIVGIPIQLGVMVCIKKNTIRPLHITSPVSGTNPTTWYAEDPRSWNGCAAQWSIVQTPFGVAYLGWDHWYIWDGAKSTPIADEFDTNDILTAQYGNVVAHWDKGDLIWSYTDRTAASQVKDRVARYNFKRKALSYDVFTISGASVGMECLASRFGDDENQELFMGDAANGFVYKTEQLDIDYALRTKTECNAGTKSTIFVGGTESSPYIEIGSVSSASAIPNNTCIFWDNPDEVPEDDNGDSSGWTEVTGLDGKYVKIDSGAVGATGTVGTTLTHAEQVSTEATEVTYINWRVFKKQAGTTEYQFPVGAIAMYDQTSDPTGWSGLTTGRYVRINSDTDDTGLTGTDYIYTDDAASSTAEALDNFLELRFIKRIGEEDTWDGTTKKAYTLWYDTAAPGNGFTDDSTSYENVFLKTGTTGPSQTEGGDTEYDVDVIQLPTTTHASTGSTGGTLANSYDGDTDSSMNHSAGGGEGSFNATCYSIHTFDTAQTITSVYYKMSASASVSGHYNYNYSATVKVEYSTDSQENWTTLTGSDDSASGSGNWGGSSGSASGSVSKDDTWTGSIAGVTDVKVTAGGSTGGAGGEASSNCNAYIYEIQVNSEPYSFATFHIMDKILGKMQDFNAAILAAETAGTWTSPSSQINADTLKKIYWNETISGTDNVLIHTRTGASQGACEAASWSAALTEPNGSDIASTANVWIQYKIELTATDTTVANPRVYFTNGYVVKYIYAQIGADADDAVEFRYKIGVRNFKLPLADKIFKKIGARYEGTQGSILVKWETENTTGGEFTVDLSSLPERWDSFFPSDAFGKEITLEFYKNDLYDLKLKEFRLYYSPEPILI